MAGGDKGAGGVTRLIRDNPYDLDRRATRGAAGRAFPVSVWVGLSESTLVTRYHD